jgi:hypothetical protein
MKTTLWTVHGINWRYKLLGSETNCPIEVATRAVELLWSSDPTDLWKQLKETEELDVATDEDPSLGIIVMVENSLMHNKEEHLIVSTPIILANAGLHGEASRIQKEWERVSEEEKIASLLTYLGEDTSAALEDDHQDE